MLNTIIQLSGTAANANTDFEWMGGPGTLFAQGTFGSAVVTLQWSIDGTTYTTMTDFADTPAAISLSDTGRVNFTIGACKLRVNVASATASTDAIVSVRGTGQGYEH